MATTSPLLHSIDDPRNQNPTLIHIPETSFIPTNDASSSSSLVLLKVPPKLPLSALSSSYIIGSSNEKPATLVSESSGTSYTLFRVETSNAFLLVPPSCDSSRMTAHLLGKGGETSFLECQFRPLPRQALLDIMKRYVFGESDGIATKELIRELQCSKKQVLEGLTDIKALEVTSEKFVLLKEELSWDVKSAVVDSCVEMGWIDDDDEKVDLEVVIKEANLRFAGGSGGYNLELDERFLRIAMMDLGCVTDDNNVVFDTDKIALYFAHTLLRERSPYPMKDFLQTWHTRLPGAHTAAPPLSVLAGLALVEKDSV
eukprot:CAMPEP_0172502900 /NCGR_PEP_ID=MMETSP1066-20121228/163947_1 /TAXON_ID=671091 /ORGANISM="Coscinodiscus wailesii, Strain CCMP2513" /LENGTH=313 /DNA_ID=CAMNT_0013278357 /DNA_START=47 /DNA_END=984 /DNA_ORIENTATION=+